MQLYARPLTGVDTSSKRMAYPTSCPSRQPISSATRAATVIAATRRGCVHATIRPPPVQPVHFKGMTSLKVDRYLQVPNSGCSPRLLVCTMYKSTTVNTQGGRTCFVQVLWQLRGLAAAGFAHHHRGGMCLHQVQQLCAVRIDGQPVALRVEQGIGGGAAADVRAAMKQLGVVSA